MFFIQELKSLLSETNKINASSYVGTCGLVPCLPREIDGSIFKQKHRQDVHRLAIKIGGASHLSPLTVYRLNVSPSYCLPSHRFTVSPSHRLLFIVLLFYRLTVLPSYCLPSYRFTVLPFHRLTVYRLLFYRLAAHRSPSHRFPSQHQCQASCHVIFSLSLINSHISA